MIDFWMRILNHKAQVAAQVTSSKQIQEIFDMKDDDWDPFLFVPTSRIPWHYWQFCFDEEFPDLSTLPPTSATEDARTFTTEMPRSLHASGISQPVRACHKEFLHWRIEGCIVCYMMYHCSDPRTSRALSRYFQVNMIEASERDSHQFAIGVPELHAGCHSMSFHFPDEHTFCGHNASIHFYSNHIFAVPWITMNNLHHSLQASHLHH